MAHDHDSDIHLSHNTIAERKKLKAVTRAKAVSGLALDVDTSAQPVTRYLSITQNDFNLSMAHDRVSQHMHSLLKLFLRLSDKCMQHTRCHIHELAFKLHRVGSIQAAILFLE